MWEPFHCVDHPDFSSHQSPGGLAVMEANWICSWIYWNRSLNYRLCTTCGLIDEIARAWVGVRARACACVLKCGMTQRASPTPPHSPNKGHKTKSVCWCAALRNKVAAESLAWTHVCFICVNKSRRSTAAEPSACWVTSTRLLDPRVGKMQFSIEKNPLLQNIFFFFACFFFCFG